MGQAQSSNSQRTWRGSSTTSKAPQFFRTPKPTTGCICHCPGPGFWTGATWKSRAYGSHLEVTGVLFRAILNENARLDEIRLTEDRGIFYQRRVGYLGEDVLYEDTSGDMKRRWGGGLVLTLHIEFLSGEPRGRAQYRYGGIFTRRG